MDEKAEDCSESRTGARKNAGEENSKVSGDQSGGLSVSSAAGSEELHPRCTVPRPAPQEGGVGNCGQQSFQRRSDAESLRVQTLRPQFPFPPPRRPAGALCNCQSSTRAVRS